MTIQLIDNLLNDKISFSEFRNLSGVEANTVLQLLKDRFCFTQEEIANHKERDTYKPILKDVKSFWK